MGFDISKHKEIAQAEDEGTFVHLHDIDDLPMYYTDGGEEKPVGVWTAGAHSTRHRRIESQLRKRKIRGKDLTAQRLYEDTIERVAGCSMNWQGIFDGDQVVPFTVDNARMLYRTCPWIMDQVAEAMQDHKRFFSKESTE